MGRKKMEEQPETTETKRSAETEQVKDTPGMAEAEIKTPRSEGRKKAEKKANQRVTTTDQVKKEQMKGHRERLRERFREQGFDSFQDYEVLELLLFYALPRIDTKPLAKKLLNEFGSVNAVLEAEPEQLIEAGVTENTALFLNLIAKVQKDYAISKKKQKTIVRSTVDAGQACISLFRNQLEESVRMLCLDARGKVVKWSEVAKGDVNAVHFPVRKIVETAVLSKAVSVILTHNHPGGTLSPSREDLDATEAAKAALGTIGVRLLDHLIVSGEDYYSLRENGYL